MSGARVRHLLILLGTPCMMVGCGVIGPPVPPETVGIAPVIERQKQAEAQKSGVSRPPSHADPDGGVGNMGPVGQDEVLPPLRPIGTR